MIAITNKKNKKQIIISKFNRPYKITKQIYNSIIPLNVYQTWNSKNLPIGMKIN